MYDRIEVQLKGVQRALYLNRAVSTVLSPSEGTDSGDEPTQLRILADVTEAHLFRIQEEKE
jgi:hypothetical protein